MIRVTVLQDGKTPVELDFFESDLNIGRGEDNEVQLRSNSVSKRHAVVQQAGTCVLLSDAGSTNGTLVNDERIVGHREVTESDVVTIGQFTLLFKSIGEPPPTKLIRAQEPHSLAKPSTHGTPQVEVDLNRKK